MSSGHKEHAKHSDQSPALMGSVGRAEGWLTKEVKKTLTLVGVAVILIIGGAIAWTVYNHKHNQIDQQTKDYTTLQSNVQKFRSLSQDDLAKSVVEAFDKKYAGKQTKAQQYYVASELAAIYLSKPDYKNGVIWQQKAVDASPNPGFNDYDTLGQAYIEVGDKTNALKYLKLALNSMANDKTITAYDSQKNFLTSKIAELEAQP